MHLEPGVTASVGGEADGGSPAAFELGFGESATLTPLADGQQRLDLVMRVSEGMAGGSVGVTFTVRSRAGATLLNESHTLHYDDDECHPLVKETRL